MFNSCKKKIRRLFASVRFAKQFYRSGGCVFANVSYIQYDNILLNKRILVTGGSSGIGLAMTKKFLSCGAKVVITGRNEKKLQDALNEINNPNCFSLPWDLTDISICDSKLENCITLLGGDIDILVNNAGIPPAKVWGNVDENEWDRIYSTNLKGMFFLTQSCVAKWGNVSNFYRKIINISSQGGFVGATYPYRMVKWDIRGLTEGLGKTLVDRKIIVNGIAPGVVKTAMQNFSLQQGDNLYTNQNPINRVCLPEEIAELACFLASDASNFIVGQTIVCDGGYTLR